jgi:hypothetical protein
VIRSDKFGVEARIRNFYPWRKKGHIVVASIDFCVRDTASPGSVRPVTTGLISAGRGRLTAALRIFWRFRLLLSFSLSPALSVSSASVQRLGQREIV